VRFAALVTAAALLGCGGPPAANHLVSIDALQFSPPELTVAAGDTITWVNRDIVPHTATAASGNVDTGNIEAGARVSVIAGPAGTLSIACRYHPTMRSTIIVK
jgi:plastocyanin